jgi:hypothetical protein
MEDTREFGIEITLTKNETETYFVDSIDELNKFINNVLLTSYNKRSIKNVEIWKVKED